jgi:hypothetical protein
VKIDEIAKSRNNAAQNRYTLDLRKNQVHVSFVSAQKHGYRASRTEILVETAIKLR